MLPIGGWCWRCLVCVCVWAYCVSDAGLGLRAVNRLYLAMHSCWYSGCPRCLWCALLFVFGYALLRGFPVQVVLRSLVRVVLRCCLVGVARLVIGVFNAYW